MESIWTKERRESALRTFAKWHGTPHRDRLAIPGVGIDCINLCAEFLVDAGIIPAFRFPRYETQTGLFDPSDLLKESIKKCLDCREVSIAAPEFGDIAIFRTGRMSGHCAFCADGEIFHALAGNFVTRSSYALWSHEIDSLLRVCADGFLMHPASIKP